MKEKASQMESGIKRTQKDYTLAFKLAVVEQVEKGELTYKEAQHRYGIQGRSTVLVWMRKHGRQGWGIQASSAAMPRDKTPILNRPGFELTPRSWTNFQGCHEEIPNRIQAQGGQELFGRQRRAQAVGTAVVSS